jgi:anti-anti-sigma factor
VNDRGQESDGIEVVALDGDVDIAVADDLRQRLRARDDSSLIVDLRDVAFMDSAALGVVLGAYRRRAETRSGFAVVLPQADDSAVRRLFAVTTLDRVLPVFLDDAAARAAIKASRPMTR